MRAGQIYRELEINHKNVILRSARWEDLYSMIDFANELVLEREIDRDFGILLDTKQTLESETAWLAAKLASIEKQ
ncbi:MAG: hypothetical protein ACYCQJ_02290 [Nitrososphaerales archaeon]